MSEKKELSPNTIAHKKWHKKNLEHSRYLKNRTTARSFVRHYAKDEDIVELISIYMNENKNSNNVVSLIKKHIENI
ncbi:MULTISPECIES: hypothetical protein [Helcococcus]|uniref:Uncharacterized protein n=1 Tax=Helcococcus bovis TaxID=3153252 RepID=A0ABW9F6D0_9FIRM